MTKPGPAVPDGFATTRWTVVRSAGLEDEPAQAALEQLCRTYWSPVRTFLERHGRAGESAEDLAQSFFATLMQKAAWRAADPDRGRFRTFLLACLTNFLRNERRAGAAQKRGGEHEHQPLDSTLQASLADAGAEDPARAFERDWALTLIGRAVARIRERYECEGKGELFAALRPSLVQRGDAMDVAQAAAQTGLSEGAVRVAVHRLRQRFGDSLRGEIRDTVESSSEVEAELGALLDAVRP